MKYTELIKPKNAIDFELIIKDYLENVLEFEYVQTTPVKGDFGADLFAYKKEVSYVIQIKFYSAPVNLKAVQEAYSAQKHFNKDRCIVITNNKFTESAINLATSTNCILIDGEDLNKIYSEKFESFDKQIEYLNNNKLRAFKITNKELIDAYFDLKKKIGQQPTINDMDAKGKFSSSTYRKRWGNWNSFLNEINEGLLVNRKIRKQDLITSFHEIKDILKRTPKASELKLYGKFSISTYERYFGSWNEFLNKQNISPNKQSKIPKEEFILEYKRIKTLLKKVPTKAEFNKYSKISSSSFRRIWVSWSKFLKEQGEQTRDITDEELIKEYYKLKVYLEKEKLTQADMNEKGKFSSSTYERRFGSWNLFLKYIEEQK